MEEWRPGVKIRADRVQSCYSAYESNLVTLRGFCEEVEAYRCHRADIVIPIGSMRLVTPYDLTVDYFVRLAKDNIGRPQ